MRTISILAPTNAPQARPADAAPMAPPTGTAEARRLSSGVVPARSPAYTQTNRRPGRLGQTGGGGPPEPGHTWSTLPNLGDSSPERVATFAGTGGYVAGTGGYVAGTGGYVRPESVATCGRNPWLRAAGIRTQSGCDVKTSGFPAR
jgi:hypothetical protein